jgi:hypothetical protein
MRTTALGGKRKRRKIRRMAYIVNPDGSIVAQSVDDAIALSLKLRGQQEAAKQPAPLPAPAPAPSHARTPWTLPNAASSFALTPPPSPAAAPPAVAQVVDARRVRLPDGAGRDALAYEFLSSVKNAGPDGLGTAGMVAIFRVDQPRGLGSKAMMIKNYYADLGFAEGEVYTSAKNPEHGTVYRPGPRIDDALGKVQARIAANL